MTRFRKLVAVIALAVVAGEAFYFFHDLQKSAPPAEPQGQVAPAPSELPKQPPPPDNTKPVEAHKAKATAGSDPFELIRSLAKSAYDGDGRAQYLISRELDRCEMTLSLVRKQPGDPESLIWSLPGSG